MKRISADMLLQDVGLVESDDKDSFIALYMFDETDVNMYLQKLNDEQFVAGLIYIDNYEEALEIQCLLIWLNSFLVQILFCLFAH